MSLVTQLLVRELDKSGMRNTVVFFSAECRGCRPRPAPRRLSTFAMLALLVESFGCLPLDDLSGYSRGTNNAGASNQPVDTMEPPRAPVATEDSEPGAPDDVARDGIVGEGAPLDPPAQPGALAPDTPDPACTPKCAAPDAGPATGGAPVQTPSVDAAAPPSACAPDESPGPNGLCYLAVALLLSWEDARASCRARGTGWDLAAIRSPADNAFLDALLTEETWVGAADLLLEGTWAWVVDGVSFWQGEGGSGQPLNGAFVNWFLDEPNGTETSDCMRLLVDASWADLECSSLRTFVCEGPPR